MNISIKGKNDYLIVQMKRTISIDEGLDALEALLDKMALTSHGFYPKALFDFDCRKLSQCQFKRLIKIVLEKQSLLFAGFVEPEEEKKEMTWIHRSIRNGEVLYVQENTLIHGQVNPGTFIYVEDHLYILGKVSGTLFMMNEQATISGTCFDHVSVYFKDHFLQEVTSFSQLNLYIKDGKLIQEQGGKEPWLG